MDRENIHKMPCVAYVQSVYEIEDDFNQQQQQLNMLPPVYLQHVYIKLFWRCSCGVFSWSNGTGVYQYSQRPFQICFNCFGF